MYSPVVPRLQNIRRRLIDDPTVWVFPLLYAIGAWLIYGSLGLFDRTHIPVSATGDPVLETWFIALAHKSVAEHHLFVWTNLVDYPSGINLVDNVAFPILSLLASPLTGHFGPVAVYDFLDRVSFFVSCLAAFLVFRKLVSSRVAAGLGGLLYGFTPYMLRQGGNHMFLVFVPLPPIVLYLLFRALAEKKGSPWVTGAWIGLLTVIEFLISAEVAVATLLVGALTIVIFALVELRKRRSISPDLFRALRIAGGFVVVAGVLLAYPLSVALGGREAVTGPTQSVWSPGINPVGTLFPTASGGTKLEPTTSQTVAGLWHSWLATPVSFNGDTAFIGILLVVAVIWIVVRFRSLPVVRAAAVFGLISWVLALGPHFVTPRGKQSSIPMPFIALVHLPVVQDVIPSRLTLYADLAAVTLLVVGIDALIKRWRNLARADLVLGLLIVFGVVLAAPSAGYPVARLGATKHVTSPRIQRLIPTNGVVLAYPYPFFPDDQAMLWQAMAGLRYKMVGGYAVREGVTAGTKSPAPVAQGFIRCLLMAGPIHARPVRCRDRTVTESRPHLIGFVKRYHISDILVDVGPHDQQLTMLLNSIYSDTTRKGHVHVWFTGLRPRAGAGSGT